MIKLSATYNRFSPVSSINKTVILLNVALNTINQTKPWWKKHMSLSYGIRTLFAVFVYKNTCGVFLWSLQIINHFVLLNLENFEQWEYDANENAGKGVHRGCDCIVVEFIICNQCLSPLTLWVQTSLRRGTTLCDKVVSDLQQVGDFLQFPPSIFAVFVYKNTFGVSLNLYK